MAEGNLVFEKVTEYYKKSLEKVEAEAVPFNSMSTQQAMGDAIGAELGSSILSGLTGSSRNAMSLLMDSTGINGSSFIQNMAKVELNAGLSSLSQYAAEAFSPVTQLLQVQPDVGMYAIAGYAAETGASVGETLSDAIDDLVGHVALASGQAQEASIHAGSWMESGPIANKKIMKDKITNVVNLTQQITDSIDRGQGLPSLEMQQLATCMADIRSDVSDSGGTMHVASTKASMDALATKVSAVTGYMDRIEKIKTGFANITSTENKALPDTSGSVLTEYSKMFKGIGATMTDVLGRIQSSNNADDALFHLPTIVANTELVNNFVSRPFGGVSTSDPLVAASGVLAASAAHVAAAASLGAIDAMVPDAIVSASNSVLSAMQQAMAGNVSELAGAVAGLSSMLNGTKSNANGIKNALLTFSANSPISSPLLNQFISGTIQSGMNIISSNLEQGKIGTGLYKISESETTTADSAIKEIQQAASGIGMNRKLVSLLAVQSRLVDDKRKHVYAAISFEEARQQALAMVDKAKSQYDSELTNLRQNFSGEQNV